MLWRGIGAFAAIAVAGAVAGHVATGHGDPPATRAIHVGAATLTVPAGWRVVDGPGTTVSNGHDRMRVAIGTAADASLVPPALLAEARRGAPKTTRLGGYRAWSYGAVTVLPSARGVLGVACATTRCVRAVQSVAITGTAILTPTPDLALRLRAPAVLATLDAARVSARAALAAPGSASPAASGAAANSAAALDVRAQSATVPGADANIAAAPGTGATSAASPSVGDGSLAAPARRLAAAHRAALDELRPVAGPALIGALSQAAQAYERLADVSSAADYGAARAAVIAADRDIDVAVASLAHAGAPVRQRPPVPATPPQGGVSPFVLLLVLATGLLVSVAAPGGLRRLRARTRGTPLGPVPAAKACRVAQRRRTPIAPPPTYGRWNEAPRGPSAGAADGDARDGVMASSSTA